MPPSDRIERALRASLDRCLAPGHPPRLAAAMQHAVFPGGARVRPKLVLAVAYACGDDDPALADAAAAAVELLHCASLVHDDLPCFDNAATRRGLPSVHGAFGERLAVLAGDALIVLAFECLGSAAGGHLQRLPGVLSTVCQGVGMPHGISAGQSWECEPQVVLSDYQQAKTGALFAAATMAGAQAAGADPAPWRRLGQTLGQAYQVADDIRDVLCDAQALGKPVGQDLLLDRPSVARALGLEGALAEFDRLVAATQACVPDCPGAKAFRSLIALEAERLLPVGLFGARSGPARVVA
ncbi:polyprenyl synthetase family protein [Pseudorhodoferax sp. Leaf267]|uniref:polyprenyl synthetase family protein n=1 Tax=Pseudorhodoferax sp. Leaf267 TaxID=1736316 RepID=UPI0006FEB41B|nr:polyprenyl synthetase family protein [Pseudorhodoferax sp. Leaf267]KQP18269.1 geranylgeranyl pyrophosphate synthase [Pseudorhodoferax sp. Leaf267]